MKTGVVISWGKDIARSRELAKELNYQNIVFKNLFKSKSMKIFDYFINMFRTAAYIISNKYSNYVFACPPTIACYPASIVILKDAKLIFDMHNGVLRKEWSRLPFLKYILSCATVISHNDVVKKDIDSFFNIRSYVLTDPLTQTENYLQLTSVVVKELLEERKINVLVPLSYAKDEPIELLLELSKILSKSHNFIFTGRAPNWVLKDSRASNVSFSGFIDNEDYYILISRVDAVACLTMDDKIQMCALIESISFDKPVICSDNSVNHLILDENYPAVFISHDLSAKDLIEKLSIKQKFNFKKFRARYSAGRIDSIRMIFGV